MDPKLLDALEDEFHKRLSKEMSVVMDADLNAIPMGALVISGCITQADPGNPTGRLVGMNLDTSHLSAHVRILSKKETGFVPLEEFEVQTKGGKLLLPLGPAGLATHAAAARRETLSADAIKLADQILKKLAKMLKSQEGVRNV